MNSLFSLDVYIEYFADMFQVEDVKTPVKEYKPQPFDIICDNIYLSERWGSYIVTTQQGVGGFLA